MKEATPQETFDHMLGAGALGYDWWISVEVKGVSPEGDAQDDWEAFLTCEDGNDGHKVVRISHHIVMETAKKLVMIYLLGVKQAEQYVGAEALEGCAHLLFAPDEADFDAASSDCLLQYIVLGEVIFA